MESQPDLYAQFVEEFFATGSRIIPETWPKEIQGRCRLFLKLLESHDLSVTSRSTLADLRNEGVRATVDLYDDLEDAATRTSELADADDGVQRYVVEKELARGGMGRVLLAYDRDFRRRVAMKISLQNAQSSGKISRFIEEAQATAQLEHPNIAPIYDIGRDTDRVPYFTMKWIRGRDLEAILSGGAVGFTQIQLLQILQQVAMGVDFAHSRGVVHRDLKPHNIMVGDYGEVLVVDWGLAKIAGAETTGSEEVTTDRSQEGVFTLDGSIQGSVRYMPPEQARGNVSEIDARSDVFGLGAILYAILTGTPPYRDEPFAAALSAARKGIVEPPSARTPEANVPPELEAICVRAMSLNREGRFASAREFHQQIQEYIEGIHAAERRAEEATRLLAEANTVHEELRRKRDHEAKLRKREVELRGKYRDDQSIDEKKPLLDLVADLAQSRDELTHLFSHATAAYHAVTSIDPQHRGARRALADLYYERLLAAERAGDHENAKMYEALVEQYDEKTYHFALHGEVEVTIDSNPAGATVTAARYVERGLFLEADEERVIGTTPLTRSLPRGSYLARIRREGFEEATLPLYLDRRESRSFRVRLCETGSIPPGFLHIPGGETIVGGDVTKFSTLPPSCQHVDEFFVARYPVTIGEYCEFLNAVARGGFSPAEPLEFEDLVPSFGDRRYVDGDRKSGFRPRADLGPDIPLFAVPATAMFAYCEWFGARLGRDIRLLTEVEWERCARGADGRSYPWGNGFDFALCKSGRSRKGKPLPEPVGAFPTDVSPFGVRDLAGGVRELCAGWYDEGYRPCRGGSWYNPYALVCRADTRSMLGDTFRAPTDIGFRVCYSGDGS